MAELLEALNEESEVEEDLEDFDDDWGDEESDDDTPEADADPEEADQAEPGEAQEDDKTEDVTPEANQSFELKHLGEVKNVTKEEVVTLAQKGMDYDRVRGKIETLTAEKEALDETVSILKMIADESKISVDDLLDNAMATIIANRDGKDISVAKAEAKLLRKEQGIKKREEKLSQKNADEDAAKQSEKDTEERRANELKEFVETFPEAAKDPKGIPKEVWEAVNKGEALKTAYTIYENARLKLELSGLKKQVENRTKTTGSRASVGKAKVEDEFLKYFDTD